MQAELSPGLVHDTPTPTPHRTVLRVVSPYEDDLPVFVSRGRRRKAVVLASTWSGVAVTASLIAGFAARLVGG